MAKLQAKTEVHLRNRFGQFRAALDAAATKSVHDAMEEGVRLARANAPVGPDVRPSGQPADWPKLRESIFGAMISSRSAKIVATAPHALPIEMSASAHLEPNNPWWNVTPHPGNAAQPYLRPAIKQVAADLLAILDKNYPG